MWKATIQTLNNYQATSLSPLYSQLYKNQLSFPNILGLKQTGFWWCSNYFGTILDIMESFLWILHIYEMFNQQSQHPFKHTRNIIHPCGLLSLNCKDLCLNSVLSCFLWQITNIIPCFYKRISVDSVPIIIQ